MKTSHSIGIHILIHGIIFFVEVSNKISPDLIFPEIFFFLNISTCI